MIASGAHEAVRAAGAVDGVLLLDKPAGPSSNQVLQRAKRLLGARKAGHAGTLDPLATGLLPIVFGEASKFVSHAADAAKVYEATILLGLRTATGDITGEVLERRAVTIPRDRVDRVLDRFRGCISQVPPMYSAIKRDGQPLYRLARRGETVPRAPRAVRIDELTVLGCQGDELDVRIACSKGTYIRVLAEDIGAELGCGATLKRLRRIRVGPFDLGNATTLGELERLPPERRLTTLLPVDASVIGLPRLDLTRTEAAAIRHGQDLAPRTSGLAEGVYRLYAGAFLGLGEVRSGTLRPVRLLLDAASYPAREIT